CCWRIGRVGALLAAPSPKNKQGAASSAPTKCGPIEFANNINSFVDPRAVMQTGAGTPDYGV
ncbi:MAG: hypothetical protein JXQ72_15415, partial [Anaerolineae bacterium]|nr:hypothetical protein [Anaerolineae bacterium]